ncbi:venom allergen 5-like [Pectinophora gossypiella]|uniref:venom allergen 5-like n=1 Tax=Pectinophora gossypiella TaxID=13191 RepID=UPI00214E2F83|nr:venom allergen 5-like [Pectinophora gossypiella]XP_049870214.1 venom allergen 5-like [Pectinophora gossypiella]
MMSLVLFVLGGILFSTTEGCGYGKQMIKSGGLSAYEKQAIVDAHNRLRQSVALGLVSSQPPAANMMEMMWDEELAATAQRWADQCTPAHDSASQREVGRWPVGQNLAATWTTRPPTDAGDSEPDFLKQINAWFDEVHIYYFRPISGGHGTGHYSQLVWGETSHIGCGFTFYYDQTRGYTKLYVCNYGPGGNVIGSNPYEKGSPSCNAYGLSDSRKYSGLCSASFTTSSSYQTVDNTNSYISNVIPDSNTQYDFQFTNQYYNNYDNQYNNQYQYQYQQPETYYQTETTEASTFRPLISIFKTATNLFTKPKSGSGFRFGTLYNV